MYIPGSFTAHKWNPPGDLPTPITQTAACAHSQTLQALTTRTHRQVFGEGRVNAVAAQGRESQGLPEQQGRGWQAAWLLQGLTPQNPASLL